MLFGRVHGTAVCTMKIAGTEGLKLLVVQPLNRKLEAVGKLIDWITLQTGERMKTRIDHGCLYTTKRPRGNRAAASFFKNRTLGLLVGLVFSSCLFMLAHGAGDPWLNLFYFCFGAIACIMTWRTGGLEAAIAMHAVNNLLSEASLPFSDISDMFNREAGTADASVLIGVVVPLIGLALVEWQARRQQIIRATAPAAALQPQRLGAKNQPALS